MTFSRSTRLAVTGLAFMALVSLVDAACPNGCSEKGVCGAFDKCTCYAGYTEADCSSRMCEEGKAWADVADTTVTGREPHHYAECSGKGTCDREKGVCECLEGFEGKSCGRLVCPEGCSGHGVCQLMEDANSGYALWDGDMIQVCTCDNGWSGIDCSARDCQLGDDPLSSFDSAGSLEVDEVQTITITLVADAHASADFILGYTDWRGETLWTHAIAYPPTAIAIEEALEALPDNAIPTITVSAVSEATANRDYNFFVTFSDAATKGDQPALQVGHAGCNVHGCQPVYYGIIDTAVGSATVGIAETTPGTAERSECSGRGVCDSEFGLCTCFDGYYGDSCNRQTIIM